MGKHTELLAQIAAMDESDWEELFLLYPELHECYRKIFSSPAKVGGDEREAELNSLATQLNASNERNGRLREALQLCAAELFANCADSPRAMSYVTEARTALDADGYGRAALSADGGDRKDAERYRLIRSVPTMILSQGAYLWGEALDVHLDAARAASTAKGDA